MGDYNDTTTMLGGVELNDGCFGESLFQLSEHLPFVALQLQMLIVFCVTQCLHHLLFKPLGFQIIVSQLMAGILLGKSVLGKMGGIRDVIFPPSSQSVEGTVAMLGYTLSLFLISVKIDFTIMMRTGRKSWVLGLAVLGGTLLASTGAQKLIFHPNNTTLKLTDASARGVAFSATFLCVNSFPVIAALLRELGLLNSELGRMALSAVLASEITCICVMMYNNSIAPVIGDTKALITAVANISVLLIMIVGVIFVMRPCMRWMIRQTPKGRPVKGYLVNLSFFIMLVGALCTDAVKQFVLLGAYIVGAGVLDGPPLGSTIVDKLDTFITGMLEPYLMATCTMKIDFSSLITHAEVTKAIMTLFVVVFVAKITMCLICSTYMKMEIRDALAFAFIVCTKGFMDVASVNWWYDLHNISEECFVALEICCLIAASICPIAVKTIYDPLRKYAGYQVRDIVNSKSHAELRILQCILRTENVGSMINLLDISSPTTETPTAAYILHLIKLRGLSQPIFISHEMQTKKDNKMRNYSDDVVWAFKRFERNHLPTAITLHPYTAVSPADAMHEDICTLALDKSVSLIILPYHRRYGFESCIEYDDVEQRTLNCSVLARSPCSVAVLIDRSDNFTTSSSKNSHKLINGQYRVGVIFIGGRDDREALAYAKRMRLGNKIHRLDVIRIAAQTQTQTQTHNNNINININPLNQQDSFAIKEFQESVKDIYYSSHSVSCYSQQPPPHISLQQTQQQQQGNNTLVNYVEVKVTDGADTAMRLREIAMQYDLLLVGRRYNVHSPEVEGLAEWTEVEELGIVGDLLAAPDLNSRASVLVVQRQRQWIRKNGKNI